MDKISILIPTYNDSKYIEETLDSVYKQDYKNYEILICDDGSTDNTKEVIYKYKDKFDKENKIKYIYDANADQLNAIIKLIPSITGNYVYILHSDDILYDNTTLTKMINYMNENNNIDSIISDLSIIDKNSNETGLQKIKEYKNKKGIIPLQLLWLGRNLYVDMAFHKKEVFINNVYKNYLLWNGPFWLNLDTNDMLNVKKVNFPFFKYRVFEENYLNSEGANLNVINGEIRVVTRLLKNYDIPCYNFQYIIFRFLNKLKINYIPFYLNKETKNKYKIIKFVLNKRFTDKEISENIYLDALLSFYKQNNERAIKLDLNNIKIYYGKDMRLFNNNIKNNKLEDFYINLFKNMKEGFNEIIIDKKYEDKAKDLLKFLSIYPYVKITIDKSKEKEKKSV